MKPHRYAEWVKKFVDGEHVQGNNLGRWYDIASLTEFDEQDWSEFRIKPRDFIKGRWYPVVDEDGNKHVCYYSGGHFWATLKPSGATMSPGFFKESNIEIGEPLPEIEWPEGL